MVEGEEYKNVPKEFWPKDKLEEYDRGVAMELAMEGQERTGDDQDQLDQKEEQARIIKQQEAIEALNSRRSEKNESKPKNAELDYEPTSDEIEYMIKNNPEVNKKALELHANQSLNPEQKTAQLCDFIRMITDQAFDHVTDKIKKKQKRKRKPTEAQIIAEMKQYLCKQAGWKMHQFKGMSYDEVRLHYYTAYKRNSVFCARGSKEEAEWIKRNEEFMKGCRAKVKRQKFEKAQAQINPKIILIEDDFYPDPLQVKHPIVDWEVHTEDDLKSRSWKITRVGGETSSFISFAELVKACDRGDIDTLWRMVQDRQKAGQLTDVKAQDLWVYLKRLYESESDVKYWKFEARKLQTTWTYYDTCEVHQVTTTQGVDAFMFTEKEYPLKAGTQVLFLIGQRRPYQILVPLPRRQFCSNI